MRKKAPPLERITVSEYIKKYQPEIKHSRANGISLLKVQILHDIVMYRMDWIEIPETQIEADRYSLALRESKWPNEPFFCFTSWPE